MSKVVANVSMSLDGFIANEAGGVDGLSGWMGSGDVDEPTAGEGKSRMFLARESRPAEGQTP